MYIVRKRKGAYIYGGERVLACVCILKRSKLTCKEKRGELEDRNEGMTSVLPWVDIFYKVSELL
jgi:hypothetical protein